MESQNTWRKIFAYEENCIIEQINIENVEKIYSKLTDEISREIYKNRCLASLTMDVVYMRNVILSVPEVAQFYHSLQKYDNVYIYGAGVRGRRLPLYFSEINWVGYIDQFSEKSEVNDLPVVRIENVCLGEGAIVVSPLYDNDSIICMLVDRGIPREQIFSLCGIDEEILYPKQYFEKEIVGTFGKEEAFIDCGAYNGEDSIKFAMNSTDGKQAIMYVFEPNINNYNICRKSLSGYPNAKLYNEAVGEHNGSIKIDGDGSSAKVSLEKGESVHITKIDDICDFDGSNIGFIKMDLEGYEEKALRGAENIIKTQKPKIAVSIYHKRWDIFRIPTLLLELNSEYKFYLRHYTTLIADTVLYAV